jgi:hypothetical protein
MAALSTALSTTLSAALSAAPLRRSARAGVVHISYDVQAADAWIQGLARSLLLSVQGKERLPLHDPAARRGNTQPARETHDLHRSNVGSVLAYWIIATARIPRLCDDSSRGGLKR